jgi:integrase
MVATGERAKPGVSRPEPAVSDRVPPGLRTRRSDRSRRSHRSGPRAHPRRQGVWPLRPSNAEDDLLRPSGIHEVVGNPLSDGRNPVWRLPSGFADRRNWVDRDEMVALYRHAEGRARVRVVLQGFNGLRGCEVRRLRVRDLRLQLPRPTLTIHGKGRFGGKYRTIPMDPMTRAVLLDWVSGKGPDEGRYPVGHTVADAEMAAVGVRAGRSVRVTGRVLRRSSGCLAYQAGVPVPTIQRIFGQVSVDQTLHYIGVGQEVMTEGFAVFHTYIRAGMEPPNSTSQRQTAS